MQFVLCTNKAICQLDGPLWVWHVSIVLIIYFFYDKLDGLSMLDKNFWEVYALKGNLQSALSEEIRNQQKKSTQTLNVPNTFVYS